MKCAGTDWSMVTTNDGKRYYYNAKTKLSSWQIPADVAELRKKQESDALKEQSIAVQNVTTLTEKGSGPLSLNAPAITTGGRDAIPPGPHGENGKDKVKDDNGDGNVSNSSSDSDDVDTGPTKEERAIQFKVSLYAQGACYPFSKWEKELPKFVFDPRFKDITHNTDYQTFKRKWGHDPRFEALDRKEREALLNERVIPLMRSVEEEAHAKRAAIVSSFKSMLRENKDISSTSRWSKVKDMFRNDSRYKSVKHEDREDIFNEYMSELKDSGVEAERAAKAKRDEELWSFVLFIVCLFMFVYVHEQFV
ncbi:putative WW domain, FF domain, WW domain superfamily, FF domain superfamily protein [Helianthus annuus]|uniref:WW domain, FF domain, WW domain superfamily, FF domain superfamily protein n=1 Tax=Helianthus annuus TaxID=4232 RepID=A0A9K3HE22_HELAN|nr:putative WW domain, FF domain, WW domain superfamily, FF domain superfamily protein [Helianthus annuus]